jgi:hypothetical protein
MHFNNLSLLTIFLVFKLKKLKFETTDDSTDGLYNVASNIAYYENT